MTRRIRSTLTALGASILLPTLAHAAMLPGRPVDVSLDGHRGDWLFDVTTISVTLLFVVMVAIMLGACLLHRDKPESKDRRYDQHDHGIGRSHLMLTAAISSVIFFGVDGVLLVSSYNSLHEGFWNWPAASSSTLEVEVVAQQWGWNVRYAGPDHKFGTPDDIVKWNELVIPKDAPVTVKLKSKDVIHSFYLPNFRTKQDAVPGYTTKVWFQATATGDYEIGCAQHCGVNHYKMRGELHVLERPDFDTWMIDAAADAARRYDAKDADAHWGWDWES